MRIVETCARGLLVSAFDIRIGRLLSDVNTSPRARAEGAVLASSGDISHHRKCTMPSITKEILIDAAPEHVWAAVRDVGAVHQRLVPGLVTNAVLEDGARTVTFANGLTVRERIVTIDDATRRLVYSATGGRATHHNSSLQVFGEADGKSRLVWITDLLPEDATGPIGALVEQGARVMKETLERDASRA